MKNESSVGSHCREWWQQTFGSDDGFARMVRARLRRCTTPVEALMIENVHDLNKRLCNAGYTPSPDQLAIVSVALAHVDGSGAAKLAGLFGFQENKNSPRTLSTLRFQRLIHTKDRAQLIVPLRRAMTIVNQSQINIVTLANDLYFWNESARIDWCLQYFGGAKTEPQKDQTGDQNQ